MMIFQKRVRALLAFVAALPLAAPAGAAVVIEQLPPMACTAEVVMFCDPECKFIGGPNIFYFDFKNHAVKFCRGSRCDDGKISIGSEIGSQNGADFLVISGKTDDGAEVKGMIALQSKTFYGDGDAGEMMGSCTRE
jgi:hypothetical protein